MSKWIHADGAVFAIDQVAAVRQHEAGGLVVHLVHGGRHTIEGTIEDFSALVDVATTPAEQTPPAESPVNRNADPASDFFEEEVTELAEDLWSADPGRTSPAESFASDYAHAQDRYYKMARNLLDPGAKEGEER